MNRKISLSIEDIYIKYTGEAFGATGSHNAVTLRMIFGSAWDGTAKTAYFTDALGSASVSIVLGLDKLVGGAYEVDVPSEALKYAGEATVTIKGVLTSGDTTTKAITTAAGHFRVLDSELPDSAGNAGTITASDKEQLQAEIAGLENLFTTTKTAAETAAANAKVSETNAKASETAAAGSASSAEASKTAAADSAVTAAGSAAAAAQSAASVEGINKTAESWAVGGTGTREGENTNNAKYWAQQAEATVGGDFATKPEAQGYVADHNQSAAAHSDIREAVSEAGKAFVITGTLAYDELDGYTVSGVTVTEAEIQAAIAAGKAVVAKLTYSEEIYELPLVYHYQSVYHFGGNLESLDLFFAISYTESGIESRFSQIMSASADSFGMLSDDVSYQSQILTTHINDTNIHVTAGDKTAWNAKAEKPKAVSVTLTAAGWDSSTKKQTVTVPGVLADTSKQVIWVTQTTEAAIDAYLDAGIVPVAQGANSVTFRADTIPTAAISVPVVMQEVYA